MTELDTLPMADVSDMVEMHRVFRNALAEAPGLVGPAGDGERVGLVSTYYDNVLRLLHVHHESEDLLVTPKLLERQPAHADLIRSVAGQHAEVLGSIEAAESRLADWQSTPSDTTRAATLEALAILDRELTAHLDMEERDVLPLAGQCINVAEWGELPGHGLGNFDGDKMWLILGLIRDQFSPQNLAEMDAHLPPPVANMWAEQGESRYRGFLAQLHS